MTGPPLFRPGPPVSRPGGTELATWDLGGSGPPLLLLHATGLHSLAWLPLASGLRHAFHCYAFDLRGHGCSSEPADGDYDWRTQADDATAVLHALDLVEPVAVGHSCGGAVAVLAEEAAPGTWQALYCWEPILFDRRNRRTGDGSQRLVDGAMRRRQVFASRQAAFDNYQVKAPFDRFDRAALKAYVEYGFEDLADGTVRLRCRGRAEAAVYTMADKHDGFERLETVAIPVTVACGADGADIGPDETEVLASRLPQGRAEVFHELGHFGPLQRPAVVAAAIVAALTAT